MQDVQNAHDAIDRAVVEASRERLPEYELYSCSELLRLDIPPMEWVVGMMIPNPGLVVLSGKPGSYKTFFALWLGLRIGAGLPLFAAYEEDYFCDEQAKRIQEKIVTLFIEEENTKQTMKERVQSMREFNDLGSPEMYCMIDAGFKFKSEAWRAEVLKIVREKGVRLLILDPFSSVMGLENENDNAEVAEVMDIIRKEFVQRGLSVILIHHPSKGDGDGKGVRGAGDILGKCDVHLSLEVENKPEKLIRVEYQKLRVADSSKVADFKMRLASLNPFGGLAFRYVGQAKARLQEKQDETAKKILVAMEDGQEYTRQEIADITGISNSGGRFSTSWSAMLESKQIQRNPTSKKYYKNAT